MGRFALPISLFILIAALGSAQAQVPMDDAALCRTAAGDVAIAACTRAISSGKFRGNILAVVYNKRGMELAGKSESDKAIADYDEALRLDPNFVVAYYNRAWVFRKKREPDRAIADYTEAIRINPKYALAYNARGITFNDKAEYDRAIADFDAVIALDPRLAFAFANRALSYRGKNDHDHALADYNEALRLDPKNADYYSSRGITWRVKGDFDRSIADFDAAITLNPRLASAYADRAWSYRSKNDFDHALADFNEAIRLDPKNAAFYGNRGITWRVKGDFDRAIADLDTAIKLDAKIVFAYRERGNTYLAKGDTERAIADFSEAIRLSPNTAMAHNWRGLAYKIAGDLERALLDLNEAIRLAPTFAAGYANRGDVYRQKGDLDRAIVDLDEALRLNPNITTAYTNRGLVHEARGDLELARSDFTAAVQRPQIRSITGSAAVETARARLAALAAASTAAKPKEKRVALVIGNSDYRTVPVLPNARRDADAVAAALRNVGFETVNVANDLPREKFVDALRAFARISEQADWALIYYAGHGMELNGTNYLIPVDARLETDRDVQLETLPLNQLLSTVEGAHKLRIILLDACRENPFARQMRRTLASRSIGRGLARVEPEGGTLVAYAAKDGEVALDGEGSNSPFVTALVRRIVTPGIEISKLFRLIRDDVLAATGRRQEPFVYGSLPGEDFYFAAPVAKNGP
jgi:tetratricopeptide (TPR) repeat protein